MQWAKSVLQEQGLDDCSVTKILDNYTKPLGLPFSRGDGAEQTGDCCTSVGPDPENTELCRQSAGTEGAQSPEGQNGGSEEGGDAAMDPGSGSGDQEQGDSREMAEGSCHRDPPVLCGCEGKQSPEQRAWEGMDLRECAPEYVLVQEEEEGSSCPEDDSTRAQGNVRKKRILIF